MSAIVTSVPTPRPLDLIRQALAWAQLRGIRVRLGEYGIEWTGAGWWLKPGSTACCPLAAVVLMAQPLVQTLPEAPAVALGTGIAWCEGFAAGVDKEPPSGGWLRTIRRQSYLEGWEAGTQIRIATLSVRCITCGVRHTRGEPCPCCEIAALAARDREDV